METYTKQLLPREGESANKYWEFTIEDNGEKYYLVVSFLEHHVYTDKDTGKYGGPIDP